MSLSVTNELDVFDALALLLKPEGVMVKNELYMDPFSSVFDYTTQIYYESPVICSQALAMGSNTVDFLHATPKDHKIESLLYEPLVTSENRYDFLHDYRKNDAIAQGKCGEIKKEEPKEQGRSAGIIVIVEAENTTVDLLSIKGKIQAAVKKAGFTPVTVPSFDNGVVLLFMKEGYVAARVYPEEKYCGFDIQLWGSFHRIRDLRAALVDVVGSTSVSSYRIVVGGMYGSSTWKQDQKIIGPKNVQTRNCVEPKTKASSSKTEDIMKIAIQQSINVIQKTGLITLVVCGVKDKGDCFSADLLREQQKVNIVIPLWTCPGIENDDDEAIYNCEKEVAAEIGAALAPSQSTLDLVVVDSTVPYAMLQVLNSILSIEEYRTGWIDQEYHVFVAFSTNADEEPWRRHFLDRYRKQDEKDPVARGEFLLQAGDIKLELGVVASGDEYIANNLATLESMLEKEFNKKAMDVSVELRTIHGGLFHFEEEFEPTKFLQSDYDNEPGEKQYEQQEPLGRQNIFQLEPAEGVKDVKLSSEKLSGVLEQSLDHIKFEVTSYHHVTDVGDGAVIAYFCKEGSLIAVWDGRQHVDINFFTFEESPGLPETFMGGFLHFVKEVESKMHIPLRDDQPRGIGRVVNFPSDLVDDDSDEDFDDDSDEEEE
jgi:hypothetical protein